MGGRWVRQIVVKVVKVKMVIFIFGMCHCSLYINIKYLYIVEDFDNSEIILTK